MMTKPPDYSLGLSPAFRMAIAAACVVIVVGGVRIAAPIVNPILLALVIALMITPLLRWFVARGLPFWLALVLVTVIVFSSGLATITFMGLSLSQLADNLPAYEARFAQLESGIVIRLEELGIDAAGLLDTSLVEPGRFVRLAASFLGGIGSALANASLMLAFIGYMLLESKHFPRKLRRIASRDSSLVRQLDTFTGSLRNYMYIRAAAGAAAAALDVGLLLVLGVDFAVLWGILSFLMSFIPSIGYIIALVPPLLLAVIELGVREALIVFFGYWVINGTIDTVLAPRFMSQGLNMSPLVIILSLTVWVWILGATGAILAVPLTMIVKQVLLEGFDSTRPFAILLSVDDEDSDAVAHLESEPSEGGVTAP